MDPLTIALTIGGVILGHLGILRIFLPKPTPEAPSPPTAIGHGELARYVEQIVANTLARLYPAPALPRPSASRKDIASELEEALALLLKRYAPTQTTSSAGTPVEK